MNPMMMKEVSEISKNNISESPLGKSVEGKDFDKPMTEYDKPFENKYSHNPIEGSSGHWEGERGESKFIPDSDAVPKIANSEGKTFGEIKITYTTIVQNEFSTRFFLEIFSFYCFQKTCFV